MPYPNNSGKTLMDEREFDEFTKTAKKDELNWNNYFQDAKVGE